ncbi:MAG: hypothetical protein QOE11_1033 [Solirubrobacteraceae bacterium]|nr:hypothetical protein [Solirubrobacteraceae bacterium]
MSTLARVSSQVVQAARYLIAGLKTGGLDEKQVDKLVRAVGSTQLGATPEESAAALAKLSEGLELPDTANAEIAARVLGAMIEAGHDPQPARGPMLACLRRILPLSNELADVVRPQVGEPPTGMSEYAAGKWVTRRANEALRRASGTMPEASEAWERLQAIWPGAIALLSADPEGRAEAADLQPLAGELQDVHEAAGWLTAMLSVVHEAPFVAIEPATGIGITGRMSGIVDNFQLNVLLMEAVPWTGSRGVARGAAATARGEGPQQTKETVEGVWDLYSYAALAPDGSFPPALPDGDEVDETLIWDEGMPAHIPVLDGHHVILLAPTAYERNWRAQRMFANLPASLDREVLDEAGVAQWLERIRAAAAATQSA